MKTILTQLIAAVIAMIALYKPNAVTIEPIAIAKPSINGLCSEIQFPMFND